MNLDVAGDMTRTREKTRVVPPGGPELASRRRDIVEFPDLEARAEGQAIARQRQPHGVRKGAEMRVEVVTVFADNHQTARLVGGDEERNAELPDQGREARRVNAPQRRRFRYGVGVGQL